MSEFEQPPPTRTPIVAVPPARWLTSRSANVAEAFTARAADGAIWKWSGRSGPPVGTLPVTGVVADTCAVTSDNGENTLGSRVTEVVSRTVCVFEGSIVGFTVTSVP